MCNKTELIDINYSPDEYLRRQTPPCFFFQDGEAINQLTARGSGGGGGGYFEYINISYIHAQLQSLATDWKIRSKRPEAIYNFIRLVFLSFSRGYNEQCAWSLVVSHTGQEHRRYMADESSLQHAVNADHPCN